MNEIRPFGYLRASNGNHIVHPQRSQDLPDAARLVKCALNAIFRPDKKQSQR